MKRAAAALVLLALTGCRTPHRADEILCLAILNRTIDLELAAMGYHDPALIGLKCRQLRETLKPTITQCIGRPAPKHALACVQGASSLAELTHDCLSVR
jgi:hypothetical protein